MDHMNDVPDQEELFLGSSKLVAPVEYPPLFPASHHSRRDSPAAATTRPCLATRVDVNPAFVVENPRESHSALMDFLSVRRAASSLAPPSPELNIKDFSTYLHQLHIASSKTGLADTTADIDKRVLVASAPAAICRSAFTLVPPQFFEKGFRSKAELSALVADGQLSCAQERLNSYLENVEFDLLTILNSRSKDFFEALETLQSLRDAVALANSQAKTIRGMVTHLRMVSSATPLLLLAAVRRKERRAEVARMLRQLQKVAGAVSSVAMLIASGDLMGALELVTQARIVVASSLQQIHVSSSLRRQLDGFERLIGDTLVTRFSSQAVTLIIVGQASLTENGISGSLGSMESFLTGTATRTHVAESSAEALVDALVVSTHASGSSLTQGSVEAALQRDVKPLFNGILQTGRALDAIEAFQDAFIKALKLLVKSEVQERVAAAEVLERMWYADNVDMDVTPARLHSLSPSGFASVLQGLCKSLLELLHRMNELHELIEAILDMQAAAPSASNCSSGSWGLQSSRMRAASAGLLAAAIDAAQRHVVKLMSLRRDQSARMKVREMRSMWDTAATFSTGTTGLLAHAGALSSEGDSLHPQFEQCVLMDECLNHARSMLQYLHTRNVAALAAMLESESWKLAEVPPQVQTIADAICLSVSSAPGSTVVQTAAAAAGDFALPEGSTTEDDVPSDRCKLLVVKSQVFHMVGTAIMVVKMLGDYSGLAEAIPDIAGEVIASTVELLRTFNSRSSQLVLGAGAMHSAHLKRITAKHLALAGQSLGAILALLPSIRGSLIMRLPPSQHILLQELAKVTFDYMQHEQRILTKFVAIVKDLFIKCLADMKTLRWGDELLSMTIPTPPMRELVKGISTLCKILAPILRADQLHDVFARIVGSLNALVPVQYGELLAYASSTNLSAGRFALNVARKQLLADAQVLMHALEEIVTQMAVPSRGTTTDDDETSANLRNIRQWMQRQLGDTDGDAGIALSGALHGTQHNNLKSPFT